jgi:8-oxo-dGTP pyrophosphatase MutT (NUDIX family)
VPSLADLVPEGAEAGVGLALQDGAGRYLFFLAGTRHGCPPGERFYAGIGGHREAGEEWVACAHREAQEEVGVDVELLPAPTTWYLPHGSAPQRVEVADRPRPLALYEMVHPAGTPRAGELYRIVIYRARLGGPPRDLPPDEVGGVLALTAEQVVRGLEGPVSLGELLAAGAAWVAGPQPAGPAALALRLYPLGTARALGHVLRELGHASARML